MTVDNLLSFSGLYLFFVYLGFSKPVYEVLAPSKKKKIMEDLHF